MEVCGICGLHGHDANVCAFTGDFYTSTNRDINLNEECHPPWNDHPPWSDSYPYIPELENHQNFYWEANTNPPYASYPYFNPYDLPIHPKKPTLEDTLNTFIQESLENQEKNNQRMDFLEDSTIRIAMQIGQLAEQLLAQQELPNQDEQVKDDIILQSGKVFNDINFPEISNKLPLCVENIDGEQAFLIEGQVEEHQILQPSKENKEEFSVPPLPLKEPKTCTSPNPSPYHIHKRVCAVLHHKQLPRWKDTLNTILARKIDITHFKIFDDGG